MTAASASRSAAPTAKVAVATPVIGSPQMRTSQRPKVTAVSSLTRLSVRLVATTVSSRLASLRSRSLRCVAARRLGQRPRRVRAIRAERRAPGEA
eukprot:3075753-Prymnesium_polylepis.4